MILFSKLWLTLTFPWSQENVELRLTGRVKYNIAHSRLLAQYCCPQVIDGWGALSSRVDTAYVVYRAILEETPKDISLVSFLSLPIGVLPTPLYQQGETGKYRTVHPSGVQTWTEGTEITRMELVFANMKVKYKAKLNILSASGVYTEDGHHPTYYTEKAILKWKGKDTTECLWYNSTLSVLLSPAGLSENNPSVVKLNAFNSPGLHAMILLLLGLVYILPFSIMCSLLTPYVATIILE